MWFGCWLVQGEQRGEVTKRRFDGSTGDVVEALDDDERLNRGCVGRTLGTLAPAPTSGAHVTVRALVLSRKPRQETDLYFLRSTGRPDGSCRGVSLDRAAFRRPDTG
jgi:hypothetical protein